MIDDIEYFLQRAHQEHEAALAANKSCVRLRHLEFAQAYELRAREQIAAGRRLGLDEPPMNSPDRGGSTNVMASDRATAARVA